MLLTTGRATPVEGAPAQRGEGVALVLRRLAITPWNHVGRQCMA